MKQSTLPQRKQKVRAANLCFNCLRKGHSASQCVSTKSCQKCGRRHHTLLHEDDEVSKSSSVKAIDSVSKGPKDQIPSPAKPPAVPVVDESVSTTCACQVRTTKTVLLLTAVVEVLDKENRPYPCRVLLDSGSQVHFVTEYMANLLGIPKYRADIPITGINAIQSLARHKVFVKFRSRYSNFQATIECLVTPRVTGTIPSTKIDISDWNLPQGVQLADPEFHTPSKVDMLIGGEFFFDLLKSGQLNLAQHLPQLRETHLGWVVAGVLTKPGETMIPPVHANLATTGDIEAQMHRFWELEELPAASTRTHEEQACEEHFVSTHHRDETGRFVVRLPFKADLDSLDDNRTLALKRFLMLEKRLGKNPDLWSQYVEFIREYESLGHCHPIDETLDPPNHQTFYMPHHAVLRPTSSSTKCRVVFDASAKSNSLKLSLNEALHVGPVVQSELFEIILRFRKYTYAFSADIAKMYRQVRVAPEDTRFQRIFWREQPSDALRVLELDTVTYGTSSAPYQATRSLIQLARDESEEFPLAANEVTNDFYVDDALSGALTIAEGIECMRQLRELLSRGGFPIHKWCSNSNELLNLIPLDQREVQIPIHECSANNAIKVLGLMWDPNADQFLIANPPSQQTPPPTATKRTIYSEIAKLFDPLGLVAPVIVTANFLSSDCGNRN